MADHRALLIVNAAAAVIDTGSTAYVYVHRTLSLAQAELPAISVRIGEDRPLEDDGQSSMSFIDSRLTLNVQLLATGATEAAVISALMGLRTDVHKALQADVALGKTYIIDTRYGGASAPDLNVDTKRVSGEMVAQWHVVYRCSVTDPTGD
ncbi:MAG: hypothetical protein IPI06_14040 [Gammaproteobacteria bacterium]|nr:hypothetical protein [Gammaproteobacteria bacterium]